MLLRELGPQGVYLRPELQVTGTGHTQGLPSMLCSATLGMLQ